MPHETLILCKLFFPLFFFSLFGYNATLFFLYYFHILFLPYFFIFLSFHFFFCSFSTSFYFLSSPGSGRGRPAACLSSANGQGGALGTSTNLPHTIVTYRRSKRFYLINLIILVLNVHIHPSFARAFHFKLSSSLHIYNNNIVCTVFWMFQCSVAEILFNK
jgi:hypothetical protein